MASWADAFAGGGSAAPAKGTKASAAAASGGWGDAFAGGGSTSSGGATDPVAIAQQSLNKTAADVGYAGAFTGAAQHARDVAAGNVKPHENILLKGLSVLGKPGVAIRALGRQAEHVATGIPFNAQQLRSDYKQNLSAGQLVQSGIRKGAPTHGIQRVGADVLGFIGDVGTDPLSYLTGGGEAGVGAAEAGAHLAEAAGAKAAAEQAAEEAARLGEGAAAARAASEGATTNAAKVSAATADKLEAQHAMALRAAEAAHTAALAKDPSGVLTAETLARFKSGGAAALSAEEKAAVGVKTGLHMFVPGTRTAESLGLPIEAKAFRVLPSELTDPLQSALHGGMESLKGSSAMESLASKLTPNHELRKAIRDAAATGDPQAVADLVNTLRSQPIQAGAAKGFAQEWGAKAADVFSKIPDWAHADIADAIEAKDPEAIARLKAVGIDYKPVQQLYAEGRQAAIDKGVDIKDFGENYLPHQMTQAARDAAGADARRGRSLFEGQLERHYLGANDPRVERMLAKASDIEKSGDKAGAKALREEVKARTTFGGEVLQHGSINEINDIAAKKFGQDAYDLFNVNGKEMAHRYFRGLANAVGDKAFAKELERLGVVRNAAVPTAKEFIDKAGKTSVLDARAQSPAVLRLAAGQYGAAAQGTRALADEGVAGADAALQGAEHTTYAAGQARDAAEAQQEALIRSLGGDPNASNLSQSHIETGAGTPASEAAAHSGAAVDEGQQLFDHSAAALKQTQGGLDDAQELARNLQANADKAEWMSNVLGRHADDVQLRQSLRFKGMREGMADMVSKGWDDLGDKGAFAGKQMPDYVKSTIDKMNALKSAPRAQTNTFLKYYDKWIGLWKNYELIMPGRAVRHQIGGVWNSFLGGVGMKNSEEAYAAWRAFTSGGEESKLADEAQSFVDHGLRHSSTFSESDLTGKGAPNWNPASRNFKVFTANREIQNKAQDYLRFAMYHDAIAKGMHPLEAAQKVRTMLLDPSTLTNFERGTLRRIIPFYTFMRQNLPVQLENMVTQPGKFMAFYHAQHNIERDVPVDKLMPQYYADTMGVRTPLTSGGNRVYVSPDLPFTRLASMASWKNALSNVTPAVKLPVEMIMNEPTYTGVPFNPSAKQAPASWAKVPGLMEALSHLGLASKVSGGANTNLAQGGWSMTPKAEYLIESLLPPLGQYRRAMPMGEPGMQDRQATSVAADLLGQNFRTLTPEQQAGELYARNAKMKALVEHLQNEGKLPSYIPGFHK